MTKKDQIRFAKLVARLSADFTDTTRQSCDLWRGDVRAILAASKELEKRVVRPPSAPPAGADEVKETNDDPSRVVGVPSDRPMGSPASSNEPKSATKFQILRFWPGPEAFRFVRDDNHEIREWASYAEAERAVTSLAYEPMGTEHVVISVHRCFKVATVYPRSEPVREFRAYGIGRLDGITKEADAVDPHADSTGTLTTRDKSVCIKDLQEPA